MEICVAILGEETHKEESGNKKEKAKVRELGWMRARLAFSRINEKA